MEDNLFLIKTKLVSSFSYLTVPTIYIPFNKNSTGINGIRPNGTNITGKYFLANRPPGEETGSPMGLLLGLTYS